MASNVVNFGDEAEPQQLPMQDLEPVTPGTIDRLINESLGPQGERIESESDEGSDSDDQGGLGNPPAGLQQPKASGSARPRKPPYRGGRRSNKF